MHVENCYSTTMSEWLQPHHQVEAHSRTIYDFLADIANGGKHGTRFALRDFTLQPTNNYPSPLDVSQAYFESVPTTDEHRMKLAYTAAELIMPRPNFEKLVEGIMLVYKDERVKRHMGNGGSLKFIDSHYTYVNQVMQEIGSWVAQTELDMPSPEQKQVTIVSRITGLFKLELLKDVYEAEGWQHHGGMIFEDVLLPFAGALQTLPSSSTGNKLIDTVKGALPLRTGIVKETKHAYAELVKKGMVFFEGSSGTENWVDLEKRRRIIGRVSRRTAELTTEPVDRKGNQRVLAVPFFMQCWPFTGDPTQPLAPSFTPFAILEPRYITSYETFHDAMTDIASVGTIYKTTGELPYAYEGNEDRYTTPDVFFSS